MWGSFGLGWKYKPGAFSLSLIFGNVFGGSSYVDASLTHIMEYMGENESEGDTRPWLYVETQGLFSNGERMKAGKYSSWIL